MRDFQLEVFFARWEFSARYHMTASDAESMSMQDLLAMASAEEREAFQTLWLGYTQTEGGPALRERIAATYAHIEADEVLCLAGAEEGVYATMRVLLEPTDHAVVIVPNYQAAETIPLSICEVTGVPLRAQNGWALEIDDVRAAMRANTKLVSVNFPNNPTGAIPSRETLDALVALCREYGAYLFCDEVYRLLETDESKRIPQAADAYEKGISLNVMSKAYGLPGLRIGWLASKDTELLARVNRYKHYLSICNSGPSEHLATIALGVADRILNRNRALIRDNLAKLDAFFERWPALFDWQHPDGGCVAFPRFTGRGGVESFCKKLVEEAGVLLLPASVYRSELMDTPPDRFRIGCGRAGIDEGLAAMQAFVDTNAESLTP